MGSKTEKGKAAEKAASDYLISKNYSILERNWRFKKAEIDIIARDNDSDILVFIEVKSRSYTYFGEPGSGVTEKKQKLVSDAAAAYMEQISYNWAVRFDIIGIEFDSYGITAIRHFIDAFLM
ncbi:MAG: YraN family protein [Deltaproteobacteria bacterium]